MTAARLKIVVRSRYDKGLPAALSEGLITEEALDAAVSNILRQKFAAGLFEGSWRVDAASVRAKLDGYRSLALDAARQSITMLTNNRTLPITFDSKHIVVVGALATDECSHVGGYTNNGANVTTVWEAVQSACGAASGCSAVHAAGAKADSYDTSGIAGAAAAVAKADLVIAVVGDSCGTAGENADVDDLDLPGAQMPLLWEISKHAAPVVGVVLSSQPKTFGASLWTPAGLGRPNAVVNELGALLAAWRPGEEGGKAVVEIITGVTNPAGRLSHTWPAKAGQTHSVVSNGYHMPPTSAGGSFRFTTGPAAPLFPFGWGLSFSNFTVGSVSVTVPSPGKPVDPSERFTLSVPVTNLGPAGRATLQVYAAADFALVGQAQPVNRLLCWTQTLVPANGKATATISCAASDLGMWDLAVGDCESCPSRPVAILFLTIHLRRPRQGRQLLAPGQPVRRGPSPRRGGGDGHRRRRAHADPEAGRRDAGPRREVRGHAGARAVVGAADR